jgi:hypothetical protein
VEVLALRQQLAVLKRRRPRAAVSPCRSAILDGLAGDLVSLEGCALRCQAGNGRRLASGWISA